MIKLIDQVKAQLTELQKTSPQERSQVDNQRAIYFQNLLDDFSLPHRRTVARQKQLVDMCPFGSHELAIETVNLFEAVPNETDPNNNTVAVLRKAGGLVAHISTHQDAIQKIASSVERIDINGTGKIVFLTALQARTNYTGAGEIYDQLRSRWNI